MPNEIDSPFAEADDPRLPGQRRLVRRMSLYYSAVLFVAFSAVSLIRADFTVWLLAGQQIALGRPLALGAGLELGFTHPYLLFHAVAVDMFMVLIVLPFLMLGLDHAERVPLIGRSLVRAMESARRHRHRVRPFGALGVAVFTACPIWGTGPYAASALGCLLRLPVLMILAAVAVGDFATIALWLFLLDTVLEFSERFRRLFPYLLVAATVLAAVVVIGRTILRRMSRDS